MTPEPPASEPGEDAFDVEIDAAPGGIAEAGGVVIEGEPEAAGDETAVTAVLKREAGEDVGEYGILLDGLEGPAAGNYAPGYTGAKLTVTARKLDTGSHSLRIELSDAADAFTYTGQPRTPGVTLYDDRPAARGAKANATRSAKVPADEYAVTFRNNVNAGTATVLITDAPGGNYEVNGRTTFTILKRKATVTALNQTVNVGGKIKKGVEMVRVRNLAKGHELAGVKLTGSSTAGGDGEIGIGEAGAASG